MNKIRREGNRLNKKKCQKFYEYLFKIFGISITWYLEFDEENSLGISSLMP